LKAEVEEKYRDIEGQRSYLMNRVMDLEARIRNTEEKLNNILEKLS